MVVSLAGNVTFDAGVDMQILHQLSQADDHPLLLSFPESLYLKGLLGRKVSLN